MSSVNLFIKNKMEIIMRIFLAFLLVLALSTSTYAAKCIYCNSNGPAGSYCQHSPSKGHVKIKRGHCSYCGSSGPAGSYCASSPTKKHIVPKRGHCSYCGSSGPVGSYCQHSPTKTHVRGITQ